ncbi:SIMPL domain-containing protein [Pseudoalteromonas tunicata]|uniref:Periplasmic immunogenic protein n=1 Tax=Pseudoalteromonas tunicata D2 TaxID=87626 RepID=A4CDV4_9GAMM|nr:SIMPL domain-containing protein [Pseudoalteromonas tunicata]ATC96361.1 hypothetical protein PTUN_a4149 [Pseudoalteromonas tunicata]AXT31857.1 DUF541 domain-containing protein [Pseudoalteromonas tunicata]EAR27146.1 hypothetical protein PTD2_05730 [Pseudoalteromonas tunicata D2]MDP4984591.1 SIMPL domain-containing protein [Pseudoalteromonas tunicata]MDP5212270.1 SIMPL domain-containing protein [Pseudoalteromonas tunicata]
MKKISLLCLALLSLNTFANTALPNNRHISVNGYAQVTAKPDLAIINLEVKSQQKTSLAAKQEIDQKVNQFLAGLDKFSLKTEDVSASQLATSPLIQYLDNGEQRTVGYRANRNLKVSLKDINQVSELINFALGIEIDQVNNIEFKSSQAKQYQQQASALAVQDATEQGQALAKAFSASLGKIYSINSQVQVPQFQYGQHRGMMEDGLYKTASARVEGQYLPETLTFSATVYAVFDLNVPL